MGNSLKKEKQSDKSNFYYRPKEEIYITPLFPYKYFNRRISYYSAEMETSEEEKKIISELKHDKINLIDFSNNNNINDNKEITKIIIDTDIGTDWDDALAILFALNCQNIEIIGITTNYGIPELRAEIVKKITEAYIKQNPNKKPIPVIPGASRPMGTYRSLLIYGHEGAPFFENNFLKNELKMENIMKKEQEKASKFIIDMVEKYPNQVKIVSIGIPTNIGLALKKNKNISSKIKEIVIMGLGSEIIPKDIESNFSLENELKLGRNINLYPNHNVSGDVIASKTIFDANIPTRIIGHGVSSKFWIEGKSIDFLREKAKIENNIINPSTPEGAVGLLMNEWFSIRSQNGQCPHDPLTIYEAAFENKSAILYARGRIVCNEWAAFSTFVPMENGNHLLGVKVKENNEFIDVLEKCIMKNN